MTPSEIFTLLRQELAAIPRGEPVAVELTERTPDGERPYRVERGPGEGKVQPESAIREILPCKVRGCEWLGVENGYCEEHAEHGADAEDEVAERMLP